MESVLATSPAPATYSRETSLSCENCTTPVTGPFCANCGQEHRPTKVHFKDFLIDYLQSFINIDSKGFRSLKWLILRPGLLDAHYIQGRRASYLKPAELYLFMSVVFFFFVRTWVYKEDWIHLYPGYGDSHCLSGDPATLTLKVL